MAKGIYFGVGSKARKVKSIYIGVGGKARKVKKAYIGVGGKARQFWGGMVLAELPDGSTIKIKENGVDTLFALMGGNYQSDLNGSGRRYVIRYEAYNKQMAWNSSGVNTYLNSTVDTWLNNTYKNYLPSEVRTAMGTTTIEYTVGGGDRTVKTIARSVFLPSCFELGYRTYPTYPGEPYNEEGVDVTRNDTALTIMRTAYVGDTEVSFWTRSAKFDTTDTVYLQHISRRVTDLDQLCSNSFYVRPAFTLPDTLEVDPTPNADGSYNLIFE